MCHWTHGCYQSVSQMPSRDSGVHPYPSDISSGIATFEATEGSPWFESSSWTCEGCSEVNSGTSDITSVFGGVGSIPRSGHGMLYWLVSSIGVPKASLASVCSAAIYISVAVDRRGELNATHQGGHAE